MKNKKTCALKPENVKTAGDEAELNRIVAAAPGPVILDFMASWCGGCKAQTPALRQLACDRPDVTIVKVDVDKAEALADAWKVHEMPTLFVLKPGSRPPSRQDAQELSGVAEVRDALR